MSRLIRRASNIVRKGINNTNDPLITNNPWTDTSIATTMPQRFDAIPSARQPRSMDVTLRAAEIARRRRGAPDTGEKHATEFDTYGIFLDAAHKEHEAREAEPSNADSLNLHEISRDNNPACAQTKMTREEVAKLRETELAPIEEELETLAEPMLAPVPAESVPDSAPEPHDHADYVIKYAYEWPGVPDNRLALRRLRLATFRDFQNRIIEPRRLKWKSEAEISVGGEMLFGGNCLADADLFEKYGDQIRHLKPSEREHYQRLYGFFPEEVKAFRDNKDLILSINRAASADLKPELYEHETARIKEKVKLLHAMAQEMAEAGPGIPLDIRERQGEVFRWCVANIELHWARLMDLAAKRGQLNNKILEAVAEGDVLLMLVLAGQITTIGLE